MREILFRGKRTINGDWVEGNLFIPVKHDIPTQILIGTNIYRIPYDVIPETVGQYTGLTDKNGKKVFEGDIVKWDYPCNSEHFYQVKYDGGCACFTTSRIHNSDVIDCIFDNDGNHCEVIGNIHDNPEMMKERDRRSNESN